MNHNLSGLNRAVKAKDDRVWEYKHHGQVKMHEDENRRKGFLRFDKKVTACAAVSYTLGRRCVVQNDDSLVSESRGAMHQVTVDAIKVKRIKNANNAGMLDVSSNTFFKDIKKSVKKSGNHNRDVSSDTERKNKKFRTMVIDISSDEKAVL